MDRYGRPSLRRTAIAVAGMTSMTTEVGEAFVVPASTPPTSTPFSENATVRWDGLGHVAGHASTGHIPFVCVLRPNLPVKPFTLFVNKAPLAARHERVTWGAAQAGWLRGPVGRGRRRHQPDTSTATF